MENSLVEISNSIFKSNITVAVKTAALGLQKVQVVENELQKVELDGYLKHAKEIRKQVETLRMNETKKLDSAKKMIMDAERNFAADLDQHIAEATNKVNGFIKMQIEANRKREAEIKEAAEKESRRLRSPESLAKVELKVQAQVQDLPTVSGVRKVWKFEVVEKGNVPAEFLMIDEKAIQEAIKKGVREIAGVRIFEDYARSGR